MESQLTTNLTTELYDSCRAVHGSTFLIDPSNALAGSVCNEIDVELPSTRKTGSTQAHIGRQRVKDAGGAMEGVTFSPPYRGGVMVCPPEPIHHQPISQAHGMCTSVYTGFFL